MTAEPDGYLYAETRWALARGVTDPRDSLRQSRSDGLAIAVLAILTAIEARQALEAEAAFRSSRAGSRRCCGICGALHLGETCDLCRARIEAAA